MNIPKYPEVPYLTDEQIEEITELVFLKKELHKLDQKYDLIFVFGGSHPGCWKTTYKAYQEGLAKTILLTGGVKPNVIRHQSWNNGNTPESHVMRDELLKLGVPKESIIIEDQSTNSLENILFAKNIVDFDSIQRLVFICKSFAAGRQYRTLKKQLPNHIHISPYPFDTNLLNERVVTRYNWMNDKDSRSFVYGEYLRILAYGKKGDIFIENNI